MLKGVGGLPWIIGRNDGGTKKRSWLHWHLKTPPNDKGRPNEKSIGGAATRMQSHYSQHLSYFLHNIQITSTLIGGENSKSKSKAAGTDSSFNDNPYDLACPCLICHL